MAHNLGDKIVSDALLDAVNSVASGEQKAGDHDLSVGDRVAFTEGPDAGSHGTVTGFGATGTSEVQVDQGKHVSTYSDSLEYLGESVLDEAGYSKTHDGPPYSKTNTPSPAEAKKLAKLSKSTPPDAFAHLKKKKSRHEEIDPFTGLPLDEISLATKVSAFRKMKAAERGSHEDDKFLKRRHRRMGNKIEKQHGAKAAKQAQRGADMDAGHIDRNTSYGDDEMADRKPSKIMKGGARKGKISKDDTSRLKRQGTIAKERKQDRMRHDKADKSRVARAAKRTAARRPGNKLPEEYVLGESDPKDSFKFKADEHAKKYPPKKKDETKNSGSKEKVILNPEVRETRTYERTRLIDMIQRSLANKE